MTSVVEIVLWGLVGVATLTDVSSQRIPNWLTLPGATLALCLRSALEGTPGLLDSIGGMVAGFACLIGFYAVGGMGAGDVKLMAAVGAFAGFPRTLWIAIYSGLAGGVYALGIVVYSVVFSKGVSRTGTVSYSEAGRSDRAEGGAAPPTIALAAAPRLRYAVAVAAGLLTEALFGTW